MDVHSSVSLDDLYPYSSHITILSGEFTIQVLVSTPDNTIMIKITYLAPQDKNENNKLRKVYSERLRERIKELRKSKNLKQEDLSEQAGLEQSYIGSLESGRFHPTVFVLWKISKALDVSIADLADL
jgi:putative transcriptional regulator